MYFNRDGIKWAQMDKEARAHTKMKQAERDVPYGYMEVPSMTDIILGRCKKKEYSREEKRKINRYRQLLNHWCKVNKEKEMQCRNQ